MSGNEDSMSEESSPATDESRTAAVLTESPDGSQAASSDPGSGSATATSAVSATAPGETAEAVAPLPTDASAEADADRTSADADHASTGAAEADADHTSADADADADAGADRTSTGAADADHTGAEGATAAPPIAPPPPAKTSRGTIAVIAASVAVFAALAYQRRWIADDGMIAVRTARQIVAGNGPVYSPFERAETNTSTLWTWMLALGGWMSGVDIAHIAVLGGLLCSVVGVTLALVATNRFHLRLVASQAGGGTGDTVAGETGGAAGTSRTRTFLLPAGVLVLLGVSPFWDYATSGLESGLGFLWIGACWYILVSWCAARRPRTASQYAAVVVFGLGPLVRPEFALIGCVFGAAAWLLIRPGRRRTAGLIAAAVALPGLYEIFRAGYYGTLVPLPALTKSATSSRWSRGLDYLHEFVIGYLLWVPFTILAVFLAVYAFRSLKLRAERVLLCAPVVSGLLLGLYVVNVGGDFMHARMLLPVAFLLLLPILLLPAVRLRLAIPVATAVAVWSAAVAHYYPVQWRDQAHAVTEDERLGYQQFTLYTNPDTSGPYMERERGITLALEEWHAKGLKMLTSEGGVMIPLNPRLGFDAAVIAGRLGAVGAAIPLDDTVVDTLGLAYPLGARITITEPGMPGHEKVLPTVWILADYADPALPAPPGASGPEIAAARHAMSCGALKDLVDSTRQPMTFGRFWDNLTGSVGRTTLVVPADPFAAEKKFCG